MADLNENLGSEPASKRKSTSPNVDQPPAKLIRTKSPQSRSPPPDEDEADSSLADLKADIARKEKVSQDEIARVRAEIKRCEPVPVKRWVGTLRKVLDLCGTGMYMIREVRKDAEEKYTYFVAPPNKSTVAAKLKARLKKEQDDSDEYFARPWPGTAHDFLRAEQPNKDGEQVAPEDGSVKENGRGLQT